MFIPDLPELETLILGSSAFEVSHTTVLESILN